MFKEYRVIRPYLRGLPLIIACMVIGYFIASVYLKYTVPKYESTAKLRLADIGEGVPNSNLFKDLDVFVNLNKINAEIEVIKSRAILDKAIEKAGFGIEISRIGQVKNSELFSDAPISIIIAGQRSETKNTSFTIRVTDENSYFIVEGKQILDDHQFGDTIQVHGTDIVIQKNTEAWESHPDLPLVDTYHIAIYSKLDAYVNTLKNLDVISVDKDVPVIRISYKSPNAEKAALFPNVVADQYITDYIETRYVAANTAVNFLDQQITEINESLSDAEQDILNYRNANGIANLRQETETDLRTISQMKIQQTNLKMSLDAITELEEYINSGQDKFLELAPNFEAFTDLLSTEIVKKIKQLQSERRDLLLQYTENEDRVKVIEDKINDLTSYLTESIRNTKKNLKVKYEDLSVDIVAAEKLLLPIPENEYELTKKNREFNIYEEKYNYLNEKKIEAQIAQSARIAFHRIITPSVISDHPVSPNRAIIKIVSILMGMMFAIFFIFMVHSLKAKVNDRRTIEENSAIPVLSEIPRFNQSVHSNNFFLHFVSTLELKKLIPECRIISINGYHPDEGSSFISRELARALQSKGHQVHFMTFHQELARKVKKAGLNVEILDPEELKFYTQEAWKQHQHKLLGDNNYLIIHNENIGDQNALMVMGAADLNLHVMDARLTKASKVGDMELLTHEYNIEKSFFLLNRSGYSPKLTKDLFHMIRLLKKNKIIRKVFRRMR